MSKQHRRVCSACKGARLVIRRCEHYRLRAHIVSDITTARSSTVVRCKGAQRVRCDECDGRGWLPA